MTKFYNILGGLLLFFIGINSVYAKEFSYEKSKKENRVFAVNKDAYVEISNKYGDIDIDLWDKDSVKFEVEITAFSDAQIDLPELLDMLQIEFKGTSSFVLAETQWQEDVGIVQKSIYRFNKEFGNNVKIEVNYRVTLPDNLSLSITNKFGDIFMADYSGDVEVDLSYGDFRAHHLSNAKKIKLKSGKLKVKTMDKGHLNLSFAPSVNIEEAGDLVIESTSSEITLDEVTELNFTSKHDEVNIVELDKMIGKFTLSDVYIDATKKNVNVITKYGTFVIKEIGDEAEIIHLEGTRTDFRLGYSDVFFGLIEVDVTKESDFSFGKDVTINSSSQIDKDRYFAKGFINEEGNSKVIIKNRNGFVQLKGI